MIPITEYAGRDVAVFGLGRTGLAAAKALRAGKARVHAWDDNEETRARAEAAGIPLSDLNKRDWQSFAALVLSPGIPYRFPQPHRLVRLAQMTNVPVVGDMELFARLPVRLFGGPNDPVEIVSAHELLCAGWDHAKLVAGEFLDPLLA